MLNKEFSFLVLGPSHSNQVFPGDYNYRLQSLSFLWASMVQNTKLVSKQDTLYEQHWTEGRSHHVDLKSVNVSPYSCVEWHCIPQKEGWNSSLVCWFNIVFFAVSFFVSRSVILKFLQIKCLFFFWQEILKRTKLKMGSIQD